MLKDSMLFLWEISVEILLGTKTLLIAVVNSESVERGLNTFDLERINSRKGSSNSNLFVNEEMVDKSVNN